MSEQPNRAERRRRMNAGTFTGTGLIVEAIGKYHNQDSFPEQVAGQHLFNLIAMFRVNPTAGSERFNLDLENLITIEGPGCYWCEEPFTRELAAQPCRGHGR